MVAADNLALAKPACFCMLRAAEVIAVNRWRLSRLRAGDLGLVPAIVHYEIRRELLRAGKTNSLDRLERFVQTDPERYLHLTDICAEVGG